MRFYDPTTLKRVDIYESKIREALEAGLVPSVTEILSVIEEGPHLLKWMIKNSVLKFQETGELDTSIAFRDTTGADFGTVCHAIVEAYLEGKEVTDEEILPQITENHQKAVVPFLRWADDNIDKVVFTETFFADGELGYGGTADFLLQLNSGELILGDLKVKKHSYKFPMKPTAKYKYQLSAYRKHFSKQYGEMSIGNFLLANPTNPYAKGKTILLPSIYRGRDWSSGFEAAYKLWRERYEEGEEIP